MILCQTVLDIVDPLTLWWTNDNGNPVAMATEITTDSESPTPISYKWSVVTFSLSGTVFELFAIFLIMGFLISGPPKLGVFAPKIPKSGKISTRYPKRALPCMGTHVL